MRHEMFVIYDSKAVCYFQPWFLTTKAMAIRGFSDCVNQDGHNFCLHPEDYTLFCIGHFDDQTAEITWFGPKSLGNGIEFVSDAVQYSGEQLDFVKGDGHATA